MAGDNRKAQAELRRILWRQGLLTTAEGRAWLVAQARLRRPERDIGPREGDHGRGAPPDAEDLAQLAMDIRESRMRIVDLYGLVRGPATEEGDHG